LNPLLKKLTKFFAYTLATLVIVLAIGVGLFRLMLPRLPEYQDEIKGWASNAIGVNVEFSGMNARWRLRGPELSFFDAALSNPATGKTILEANEVNIGVGLLRLVSDRELVVDRLSVSESALDIRQREDGVWLLQGFPLDELLAGRDETARGDIAIFGNDIAVSYAHPGSTERVPFSIRRITASRADGMLTVDADVLLTDEFGQSFELAVNQLPEGGEQPVWRVFLEGESLNLAGWSALQPAGLPAVAAGLADVSLWLELTPNALRGATANVSLQNFVVSGGTPNAPLSLNGSFEFAAENGGWLVAGNEVQLQTGRGAWPETAMQLRVLTDDDGAARALRLNSGYIDLGDLPLLSPWLGDESRSMLDNYSPSGILRDVSLDASEFGGESVVFNIAADLTAAGIAATAEYPGIRNFSGRIRAGSEGGRVEIVSTGVSLDLGKHLPRPLQFSKADGTIIWRRNASGLTLLTDGVQLENDDLSSEFSLQLTVPNDDTSPVVDFQSTWSVADVRATSRYLPTTFVNPALRQWLGQALVAGRVTEGTTRLSGELENFPFDDGDGVFEINARLEDAVLNYSDQWPSPQFAHLDLIVDRTRLYSIENSAINLGNRVEDARIEIEDLREPILDIDAFATGTLESIRSFAAQSPINDVLGNQLGRVSVDGDASFSLVIRYPITDKENYEFETGIRAEDGTVRVDGFAAPVSSLNGLVTISRTEVTSDELQGQLLGQPVALALSRVEEADAPYSVILNAVGSTTAAALQEELGVPMDDIASGQTEFDATLRFPNANAPEPGRFDISVRSSLRGLTSSLPAPLTKAADAALPLSFNVNFAADDQIVTSGNIDDSLRWNINLLRRNDRWSFDRGALAAGGEEPETPDVRGLSIHGATDELDLSAWLDVGRRGDGEDSIAANIRSIDLDVQRLLAIGQAFDSHHLEVHRSGRGWVVQVTGPQADGQVTVPYDFATGPAMTLDMRRLILPGAGEDDGADSDGQDGETNPRRLPGINVRADEFGLGARRFGALQANFERTERGLEAQNLTTEDDTFSFRGSAGWIVDPYAATGQRSFVHATLRSNDIATTGQRLDYDPGIIGDELEVAFELGWPGAPRADFLADLSGEVSVTLGEGRLEDVEPGAGRVFGLMSFAALPRRLALDFRDVFDSGFRFDDITGTFRIDRGDAYTCDLTVKGPAADVGIVGRAGLVTRDYDQAAIISANVGNTLPVVGAVIGGPQVAAALLVFSQLFKKPLKDMGQAYYSVGGDWEAPLIDPASSQQFAETSSLAGCIEATP